MATVRVPTIDLSPFFRLGDEDGIMKKKATEIIGQACSENGFFQIINHGIPLDLLSRAVELAKSFFESTDEEKLKLTPSPLFGAGYNRKPKHMYEFNEYLVVLPPGSDHNKYPADPPQFRNVMEEIFSYFSEVAVMVERIIADCLGLSSNVLGEFNNDRSRDLMIALFYPPATDKGKLGVSAHKDVSCITFVYQDEVGGLEVENNGEWIPLAPVHGALIVNIGDVIQVLTNDKFKSPSHRVLRPDGRSRTSFAFFRNLSEDKWVEPLPEFTTEIGEQPKYRRFLYEEYVKLRRKNKINPPSRPEDEIDIAHYAVDHDIGI